MPDMRDARFYVCEDDEADRDLVPLDFDTAFHQAAEMAGKGGHVHVMYTDEASQSQLTQFARAGIPADLVSQG